MSGPYINNGNYRYGIIEYSQPCPAKYNGIPHHRVRNFREPIHNAVRDDGAPYLYDSYYKEPSCCIGCTRCNQFNRINLMSNIINITSEVSKILTITLYGKTKDLDKTVKLKIGNKYCISYITESGMVTVTGRLKEISANIPYECVKYIGTYNSAITTAYIGIDCSTDSLSDKRAIYIASIRYIEEIYEDGVDNYPDLSQEEKIHILSVNITDIISKLSNYIETNDESSDNDNTDNNVLPTQNTSGIIGARPPYPPNSLQNINNRNTLQSHESSEDILTQLSDIKSKLETLQAIMNSYKETYHESDSSSDDSCCNCGSSTGGGSADSIGEDIYAVEIP